ncbi:EpsG family protein [Thioalkalivibrio sp. AKL10]|uniref:EpsG family protein n=1 Tax=Thioalkalivibrio sp. AKL10 TaxID=1158158 RepID=UPI001E4FFB90|nr:EpsG family protein [Thioalkalivibrio sp. AKL10]
MPAVRGAELQVRGATGALAVLAVAPLVLLLAVRRDVGNDYANYVWMFEWVRAGHELHWIEPLYSLLNQLAAPFGPPGVILVFAVSAVLAALPLFYRVFRSSPIPWLGVLILFGLAFPFFMTNAVRSAIAIGIVMLALPAIWQRQLLFWTFGVSVAAGFHLTALIVWPLYWLLHLAWPRVLVLVGLAGAVVLSTSRDAALGFLQWMSAVLPFQYAHYPGWVVERLDAYEFGLGYLIYLGLAGLVLLMWERVATEGRAVVVFRNTAILGLLLTIALYQFWAVNRLALYFMPALAVLLPWVIACFATRLERIGWTVGFVALFGAMFARGLWVGAHQAVPYQWVL